MRKKIGCLHVHYSNIAYIEKALAPFDVELLHFVDPGLMVRVTSDERFSADAAQKKVKEQIEWIASCQVDAILITCTNYIAILQDSEPLVSIPIIKIDEPYFEHICHIENPQTILFTNPATVEGTIGRLQQYADSRQKSIDFEVGVMGNAFDLLMRGLQEEYNQEIMRYLEQMIQDETRVHSVAQLSMVDAAQQVERKAGVAIINPLDTFVTAVVKQLGLK